MCRRGRIATAALLVVAAAVVAVFLVGGGNRPEDGTLPPTAATRTGAAPESALPNPVPAGPASREAARADDDATGAIERRTAVLVLDDDARPVPAAHVEILRSDTAAADRGEPIERWTFVRAESAESGADGRCAFAVSKVRGNFLFASKAGVGFSGLRHVDLRPTPPEIRLVLHPAARVRGIVYGSDSTPAAGVAVRVTCAGRIANEAPDPRPLPPSRTTTDAEGRFAMELEPWGSYEIDAVDGERATNWVYVRAEPGTEAEVELRFQEGFEIEGIVLDPAGRAYPGARVRRWRVEGPARFREAQLLDDCRSAVTDALGRFRLAVTLPGTYRVVAFGGWTPSLISWLVSPLETARVDASSPRASVRLAFVAGSWISGRLVTSTGEPLAGRILEAVPEYPNGELLGRGCSGDFHEKPTVNSGEDGAFRIGPLRPEFTYSIGLLDDPKRVWAEGILARGVRPGTEALTLVLEDPAELRSSIVLVVEAAGTNAPIEKFGWVLQTQVSFGGWWNRRGEDRASAAGGPVRIDGLVPGERYALVVYTSHLERAVVGPFVAEPGEKEVRVHLSRSTGVAARVVDEEGRPVPFARGSLVFTHETATAGNEATATANEAGVLSFDGLSPGPYRLGVWKRARCAEPLEIELAPGERREIVVRIPG